MGMSGTAHHECGHARAATITVRAVADQLRIIQVWQALGKHAPQVTRAQIHCSHKHDFAEMTIRLDAVTAEQLATAAHWLIAQPWVVEVTLRAMDRP